MMVGCKTDNKLVSPNKRAEANRSKGAELDLESILQIHLNAAAVRARCPASVITNRMRPRLLEPGILDACRWKGKT
jgi:hypothetical protein